MELTPKVFRAEMEEAAKVYDRHVVCLEKTPEDFGSALNRLMERAIRAYQTRGAGLRHGIALDRHVTIILSQSEQERPLCGIYFNLHSPYQKPGRTRKQEA
jgi:hypothetical protein